MLVNHRLKLHFNPVPQPNIIRCSSNAVSNNEFQSRRTFTNIFIGSGLTLLLPRTSEHAVAGMEKYMKKKQLDPLETYIPGIILSQSQFHELEKILLDEKPKYQDARSLLRSGPASSLRSNIRAVAQYAKDSGDGKVAYDAVDLCLSSLEDLDSQLLRGSRNESVNVDNMKIKLGTSIEALDRLLHTVPGPILDKAKAAASAFLDDSLDEASQDDIDVKALEELLTKD